MHQALNYLATLLVAKLVRLMTMTLSNTNKNVVIRTGQKLKEFEVKKVKTSDAIFNNEHECLDFADDLAILAQTRKELQRTIKI